MEENPTVTGEFTARYTIERELGRGGAAVVYLARDNRQERHVALKILHKELAQAIGAKRFLREIKHSSALHHPHLLTIMDSGESRGTLYYVMPYMADGSLRARIAREKQLPVDDALRITEDVGEALAYAHSKGIVHRDIKPDNVLFSGDHACLADFGIARAVDSVAADTLTSTGLVVGTPAYMSPEQASGEKTVDARSDQYSLACLLYEMITGLPPFIGATQQAVISQRFTQPPPSMRAHRPNVPDHVERAVKRALAVIPADRFPTVEEFVEALHEPGAAPAPRPVSVHGIRRRWFAVGAAAAIVAIVVIAANPGVGWVRGAFGAQVDTSRFAVLPFRSEGDPAQGERVAAGLYAALSEWDGLPLERDIAVRDALAARDRKVTSLDDAIAIAKRLGVGRLVWGRITSDRGIVRVYADLYDVSTRKSLVERSATTDTTFSDQTFQELANALLMAKAAPSGMDDGAAGTESFPAWRAYSRALVSLAEWKLDEAERDLRLAVEADPDFGIAQLHLAQVLSWTRPEGDHSWVVNARRAVASRGELRERDAQRAEALLSFGVREYDKACKLYSALVQEDPLDSVAWFSLGGCRRSDNIVVPDRRSRSRWSFRSSWHEAGRAFARAYDIDPGLHAIPRFDWVRQVFPIERNKFRPGRRAGGGPAEFGALPSFVGDTIAYTPYPMPNFEQETDRVSIERRSHALQRNGDVLLRLVTSWTRTYPLSTDAFSALAWVRENRGELTGPGTDAGALQALRRARELATADADRLSLGESEVRILVKLGQYSPARSLADSVLRLLGEPTDSTWRPIARLAGLTGKLSAFESALQYFWAEHARVTGLDPTVARAGGEFLGRSLLALCGPSVTRAEANLRQLIESRVQPERHSEVQEKVTSQGLSYLVACSAGMSMARATRDQSPITRAQIAFARGDRGGSRAVLDTLERNRVSMRPGDMAVNLAMREAMLRVHHGDTATAVRILDGALDAIPTRIASILEHPLESAMLVRAMVWRADLAAVRGETATARKWASAAAELWRNADAELQPMVRRMSALARTGL